ncbi:LysR family transcriptional regulator [Streptomyces sp. ODS28]|uniref:LysR family transcriptional regulator n=1 Tax=Streptomyces sp. ODS28 TaxID=3136688 RepID=UPI0031EE3F90
MDLALLRTFLAVHRAGSFTRAAALLGLSQPAVTGQIRALEDQLGRPLFLRRPRGVTPTTVGQELAHKVAPHLDALVEIVETSPDEEDSAARTVHLTGPPEFLSQRALPALAPLVEHGMQFRVAFGAAEESLAGLLAGHYDIALSTHRPRGDLLTTTPLCDEEHVLLAAPRWLERLGGPVPLRTERGEGEGDAAPPSGGARRHVAGLLQRIPVVSVHETMPLATRYWNAVFDSSPTHAGAVIAPDLRAVLECITAGAGMGVVPRYLAAGALHEGRAVPLYEPSVPPLRTYFLSVRTGTLSHPHIARAHEWLLRAAAEW